MTVNSSTIAPTTRDGGHALLHWLREMRDEHAVWRDPEGTWHVFRYAEVLRVISDPRLFSSDEGRTMPAGQPFSASHLLRIDPPQHTILRRLVNAAFSPPVITGLTPRMTEITHELLDATNGSGEFDLVPTLTYPLSLRVISELLGLPASDYALFRSCADQAFTLLNLNQDGPTDPQLAQKIDEATADMLAYLHQHCTDRRAHPRQDAISTLVTGQAE